MQHENLFSKLDRIIKEIERIDKENPSEEETDPRIIELLDEGEKIQKELDPLMRTIFRNRKETLAEWDSIMHMCDDLDELEETKKSESSQIE